MCIKYSCNATYSPGTDMTVDCLSGSLIISDTLVCCTLLVESGSDICLIMACRQTNLFSVYCHNLLQYSLFILLSVSSPRSLADINKLSFGWYVLSLSSQPKVQFGNRPLQYCKLQSHNYYNWTPKRRQSIHLMSTIIQKISKVGCLHVFCIQVYQNWLFIPFTIIQLREINNIRKDICKGHSCNM